MIEALTNTSQEDKHGNSLNKCSDAGPNLLPDIAASLLRFRKHKVAYKTNLEKMFLLIKIKAFQRDMYRFFISDHTFQFTTLLFGAKPSLYLAIETTMYHAEKRLKVPARF